MGSVEWESVSTGSSEWVSSALSNQDKGNENSPAWDESQAGEEDHCSKIGADAASASHFF